MARARGRTTWVTASGNPDPAGPAADFIAVGMCSRNRWPECVLRICFPNSHNGDGAAAAEGQHGVGAGWEGCNDENRSPQGGAATSAAGGKRRREATCE